MTKPFLSVVIPMHNESTRIIATLNYIVSYLKNQTYDWEIIVINDGSLDTTEQVVRQYQKCPLTIVTYHRNRGKGFAIHKGLLQASGEYILICDADNATPFEQIGRLFKQIKNVDIAIGSRYVHGSEIILKQPWQRIVGSRIGNFLIQLLILPGIRDTQCGFKLFRHESVKQIVSYQTIWRWGFDMELLVIAKELGLLIAEVPVDWYDRAGSKVHSSRAFTSTLKELIQIWHNRLEGKYRKMELDKNDATN